MDWKLRLFGTGNCAYSSFVAEKWSEYLATITSAPLILDPFADPRKIIQKWSVKVILYSLSRPNSDTQFVHNEEHFVTYSAKEAKRKAESIVKTHLGLLPKCLQCNGKGFVTLAKPTHTDNGYSPLTTVPTRTECYICKGFRSI